MRRPIFHDILLLEFRYHFSYASSLDIVNRGFTSHQPRSIAEACGALTASIVPEVFGTTLKENFVCSVEP
jgi:hypothetical protein